MSWHNKVVWSEGLFLRPQLFQQQERYLEHFAHKRAASLSPFFFGFSHYSIDQEALALGKVIVKSASGIFADGTPFDTPGSTPPPAPLTIRAEHLEQLICLAVPVRVPNGEETTFDDGADSLARYAAFDTELRDTNSISQGPKSVQLSNLRLRLVPENELTGAWIGLPLTRIKSIRADGSIELDDTLVPPVAGYGASDLLTSWLAKIHDLTRLRAEALASRLTGSDGKAGTAAEVSDYLLLQTLNRYEPLLQHLRHVPTTSPAELYALLLGMAGELSTYVRTGTRRPLDSHPPYRHTAPHACLKPVVDDTHRLLNAVLVRSAQSIPLDEQGYGMRNATVDPIEMQALPLSCSPSPRRCRPTRCNSSLPHKPRSARPSDCRTSFAVICQVSHCKRCPCRRGRFRSMPVMCTTNSHASGRCGSRSSGTAGLRFTWQASSRR